MLKNLVHAQGSGTKKYSVLSAQYSVLKNSVGQQVLVVEEFTNNIDVSTLNTGTYFVRINADRGTDTIQFLKK